MNGKSLAELRTEIELGFYVYPRPDGYARIFKYRGSQGIEYVYVSCDDESWSSFDEMLEGMGEWGKQPVWTTLDVYTHHPSIEELEARSDDFFQLEERWQG